MKDLFTDGYVDHAIFQPAHLGEFYYKGFGQTDEASELAAKHPDKLTYNHNWDPRNGEAGMDQLRVDAERFGLKGVKLYTAEWHGDSRGWRLDDPWAYRYFELCRELGIRNIHVHKGPTIRPLDRDAFDVADVDQSPRLHRPEFRRRALRAAAARGLLLDRHAGAERPRGPGRGDAVHPHTAALLRADHRRVAVLDRRGPHPVLIGLRIWTPRWLVEAFVDFQIPEDLGEYAPITTEQKKKILGLNAAKMYDIPVPAELQTARRPTRPRSARAAPTT